MHLSTMCQWQFAQIFILLSRNGKRKQKNKTANPAWPNAVILEGGPENFPRDFMWGISNCSILHIWLVSHQGGFWKGELMPPLTQVAGHLQSPRHHSEQHLLETCRSTKMRLYEAEKHLSLSVWCSLCLCCRSHLGQDRKGAQFCCAFMWEPLKNLRKAENMSEGSA